jgi:hypothetical protein
VTVQVARAAKTKNLGIQKWIVDPGTTERERRSICLLIRLKPSNDDVHDLHLLPSLKQTGRFALREQDLRLRKAVRLGKLEDFYDEALRMNFREQGMSASRPGQFF